eukprot:1436512-Amphidinium_carterae.1
MGPLLLPFAGQLFLLALQPKWLARRPSMSVTCPHVIACFADTHTFSMPTSTCNRHCHNEPAGEGDGSSSFTPAETRGDINNLGTLSDCLRLARFNVSKK